MSKYHISKDGVVRQCRAKTQESCRATSSENKEHFDNKEAAETAYESKMKEKVIPKASKKKQSPTKTAKAKTTEKKVVPDKATLDKIKAKVHNDISNQRDTVLLMHDLQDMSLRPPKSLKELQETEIALSRRSENLEEVLDSMKLSGTFSKREIRDIENRIYSNTIFAGESRINFFMKNRNNPKKARFFHSDEKKRQIREHNSQIDKDRLRTEQNFIESVEDFPEWMNREQAKTMVNYLKSKNRSYSHLYDKVKLPEK